MPESRDLTDAKPDANDRSRSEPVQWDKLFRGALARVGDSLDRITGRKRDPSSIATSEIIKRLIAVIEHEKRTVKGKGVLVPHNFRLKLQWDKFSDDQENVEKLRDELLIAALDHINDNLYFTEEPLGLEVKNDYFVDGIKILASFEDLSAVDLSAAELNVTMAGDMPATVPDRPDAQKTGSFAIAVKFESNGKINEQNIVASLNDRIKIGRHPSNNIVIDDASVSKFHCSFIVLQPLSLKVADTGSTNGTMVDGKRIEYGDAGTIVRKGTIRIGDVGVEVSVEEVDNYDHPTAAEHKAGATIGDGRVENNGRTGSHNI